MNEYDETNFNEINSTHLSFQENFEVDDVSTIELFQLYYTPILVILGIIGNGLSICVFFKTKLKKLSSTYYLAALAISDSLFLLCLLIVWLNMIQIDLFNTGGFCQTIIYLSGVCSFLSVWLVVAFTVERFVAVRYPLRRQSLCTVSRAKIVILILSIIAIILFSPSLLFAKVQYESTTEVELCSIDLKWHYFALIFNIIDTIITFVIPVIIIIILNTCISSTVWKFGNSRRKLVQREKHSDDLFHKGKLQLKVGQANQHQVTKMLLIVSTVCLCLNLPSYIMRILTYLIIELEVLEINREIFVLVQHCCLQLFNTNFGINFLIYCLCGQNFRKAITSFCQYTKLHRNGTTGFAESRTQSTGSLMARIRKPATTVQGQQLTTMGENRGENP